MILTGTAKVEQVYSITVNGVTINNLRVHSEWNGLTELRNGAGAVVVVCLHPDERAFTSAFGSLFGDVFGSVLGGVADLPPRGLTVVSASPDVLTLLTPSKGSQE